MERRRLPAEIGRVSGEDMKDFRDFKVWEKAHEFVLDTYRVTSTFPKHELFGLVSQMRRCCSSIPANIAEGCGRLGNSELHRFLQISCGSANEMEYHLLLAKDLGYLPEAEYTVLDTKLAEMKRMLVALTRKVGSERKSS